MTPLRNHSCKATLVRVANSSTWTGHCHMNEQKPNYDDTGALYYIVAVIFLYGFSIFLMMVSVVRKSKQDNAVSRYMKHLENIRRIERRYDFSATRLRHQLEGTLLPEPDEEQTEPTAVVIDSTTDAHCSLVSGLRASSHHWVPIMLTHTMIASSSQHKDNPIAVEQDAEKEISISDEVGLLDTPATGASSGDSDDSQCFTGTPNGKADVNHDASDMNINSDDLCDNVAMLSLGTVHEIPEEDSAIAIS